MTSRYRVEYALKSHKRDELIEWIKGLLAVPFVLHADVENSEEDLSIYYKHPDDSEKYVTLQDERLEKSCLTRYLEVFLDVEKLIDNCRYLDSLHDDDKLAVCRLRQLVPTVGHFFTQLPLKEAFLCEDERRLISRRRLVSPSFNDVRNILNTAQVMGLMGKNSNLQLVTFDGDVTLYEDGKLLEPDLPLVGCLLTLLSHDIHVAVVTAAGYPGRHGAMEYEKRLKGLIQKLRESTSLTAQQKSNFLVMGGESNYLFRFDSWTGSLKFVESSEWYLSLTRGWAAERLGHIMEESYKHMKHLQTKFRLDDPNKTTIIRKERSLGIIPVNGYLIQREILEEIVLSLSMKLNEIINGKPHAIALPGSTDRHPFTISVDSAEDDIRVCAFNGGSDVWVDIGDKALGVAALQHYLCREKLGSQTSILKSETLHIGDQFASVGANDFRARLSACTVWIANPRETRDILDDLIRLLQKKLAGNA